jgi:hypothetical protein
MSEDRKETASSAALIAVGIMFIVIGINSSRGLIVAGVGFLIAAFVQNRNLRVGAPDRKNER